MVNINELYLMNLTLDDNDIFTIPSFQTVHMTGIIADTCYGELVKKGYMEDEDNFTLEGARFLNNVENYKKAKKYVKIGPVVIGIYRENYGILLFWDMYNDEYDFCRVQLHDVTAQLSVTYPFLGLKECKTDSQIVDETISYDDLIKSYSLKYDNAIYLSTLDIDLLKKQGRDMVTNEILFYCDEQCYYYDRNLEKLSTSTIAQCQSLLIKRVGI